MFFLNAATKFEGVKSKQKEETRKIKHLKVHIYFSNLLGQDENEN